MYRAARRSRKPGRHRGSTGSTAELNVTIGPEGPCRPLDRSNNHGGSDSPTGGGDSRSSATLLAPGVAGDGTLDSADDVDWWRIDIDSSGRLVIESTGSTDTIGVFEDESGDRLAENDDGGADLNFRLDLDVNPGTYYLRVTGYGGTTGSYGLSWTFTADDSDNPVVGQINFIGYDHTEINVSTDGIQWELVRSSNSGDDIGNLQSMAFGDGRWIAVGFNVVSTSTDGRNWSFVLDDRDRDDTPNSDLYALSSVAYGAGRWVAVGTNAIITSVDGLTWEVSLRKSDGFGLADGVAYGDGRWVAVSNSDERYIESTNGTDWQIRSLEDRRCQSDVVNYADGHWFAATDGGASDDYVFVCEFEGGDWSPALWSNAESGNARFSGSIAEGDGNWVAGGLDGLAIWSPDSSEWRSIYWGESRNTSSTAVAAYRDGRWVAVVQGRCEVWYNDDDPRDPNGWEFATDGVCGDIWARP